MDCAVGFVAAVPNRYKNAFVKHARVAVPVLQEAGATRVVACWCDDLASGQLTSFALVVQCQDDETVVFSSIVRPSRAVRDAGMDKMMNDPRMDPASNPMPFDGKRCVFGGFQVLPES